MKLNCLIISFKLNRISFSRLSLNLIGIDIVVSAGGREFECAETRYPFI